MVYRNLQPGCHQGICSPGRSNGHRLPGSRDALSVLCQGLCCPVDDGLLVCLTIRAGGFCRSEQILLVHKIVRDHHLFVLGLYDVQGTGLQPAEEIDP